MRRGLGFSFSDLETAGKAAANALRPGAQPTVAGASARAASASAGTVGGAIAGANATVNNYISFLKLAAVGVTAYFIWDLAKPFTETYRDVRRVARR